MMVPDQIQLTCDLFDSISPLGPILVTASSFPQEFLSQPIRINLKFDGHGYQLIFLQLNQMHFVEEELPFLFQLLEILEFRRAFRELFLRARLLSLFGKYKC